MQLITEVLIELKKFTFYIILLSCFTSYGQNFEVPDSIIRNLESRQFEYTHTSEFRYKIVYPTSYNDSTRYNVFLGLSGGNSNEKIVNYCYYTLFDSKYLDDYIKILPLGPSGRPLSELDSNEINHLITEVMNKFKVSTHDWLVAGTSMGGLAAYNFAAARPDLFSGIITFPGGLGTNKISEKWKNYTILLASGELDEADWLDLNKNTMSKLNGKVKTIEVFEIKGEGHIISPEYNIDKIYSKYFSLND